MKKQILLCFALFEMIVLTASLQGSHAQNPQDELIGTWQNAEKRMAVRVFKQAGKFHAEIVEAANATDRGKRIIWELSYDESSKEWREGYVQLPDMSHSAKCFIVLKNHDEAAITGFHGVRFLGSTQKYHRIPEINVPKGKTK